MPVHLSIQESVPASEPHRLQRFLRVDAVVERHNGIVEFLVGLVALAGQKHDVPGFGLADDLLNGPAAVRLAASIR